MCVDDVGGVPDVGGLTPTQVEEVVDGRTRDDVELSEKN